ncbi:MAG: LPS translocon maturation chaperone LptM [Steroidobacteraceae bacterium]
MSPCLRASLLALALGLAACGQTGPLYLPDEGLDTPVEIRPAPTAETDQEEPGE